MKQLTLVLFSNLNVYHQYAGIYKKRPGTKSISRHLILSKSALNLGCGSQGLTGDLNSKFSKSLMGYKYLLLFGGDNLTLIDPCVTI